MAEKKVVYNKVVHDLLEKLVDFNPSRKDLENSTTDALKFVFNIDQNVKKVVSPKVTDKKQVKNKNLKEKDQRKQEDLDNKILPKTKSAPDQTIDDIAEPLVENGPKKQVQKEDKASDESLKSVVATYISTHTDLETRIAYLKKFASQELLNSVEEELRKKEHDRYVQMIQTAGEIVKTEKIANEMHRQSNKQESKDEEPLDQDLFDESDLRKLDSIFKDFDHANDDHIEYIIQKANENQNIRPLMYLIGEFKNIIEKSEIIKDTDKSQHISHSNKSVCALYKKYIDTKPEEKKGLLTVLENLNVALKQKNLKIQQERTIKTNEEPKFKDRIKNNNSNLNKQKNDRER